MESHESIMRSHYTKMKANELKKLMEDRGIPNNNRILKIDRINALLEYDKNADRATITETEYNHLFSVKAINHELFLYEGEANIKSYLINKGIFNNVENRHFDIRVLRFAQLEAVAFDSIQRETRWNTNLFFLFEYFTSSLKLEHIRDYIKSRRCNRTLITDTYVPLVVDVMDVSENIRRYNVEYSDTRFETIRNVLNDVNYCAYAAGLCTNDPNKWITGYKKHIFKQNGCIYCMLKLIDFADDCTVKLGRDIFKEAFHKVFLFSKQEKYSVVDDVKNILALIYTWC